MRARVRRMWAVARVESLQLLRDRTTRALVLLVPAVQVLLFGYAVELDPRDVPVAIARAGAGARLPAALEETGYFRVVGDGLGPGEAARMVGARRALVGIELPAPSYDDPEAAPAEARVVVDATDPAAVRPAMAALERAFWRHALASCATATDPPPTVEWRYNPAGRTAWTLVPGLVGVIVMISMLMLGALTLVRDRERGSWETLLATPVDALDALVGKLAPYLVVGTVQAVVVIALARGLFALPVPGSLAALLLAVPVFAAAHLVLGFAFSALAQTQMQAVQAAVFFYLPSMLLSGFLFPFQGMPAWARAVGEALPLTHFVRAARGVLLRGDGVGFVVAEMLPVAAFAAVAAGVALWAYRRRLD